MRKIFIFVLISIFLLPTVTTTLAQSYEPSIIENGNIKEFEKYTFEDILSLEPYIQVEDGFLVLNENDASEAGIDSILIKGQQEYFIFLNQQVKINAISVSSDLTIQNLANNNHEYQSNTHMRFARCKGITTSPEYFWWGYKTKLNSCDTAKVSSQAGTLAAGGAITAVSLNVLGVWFPPLVAVSAIPGLTSGYFWLLSERLNANNKGSGVIVDMTWATIYNITPQ
ncbi:hypothetical protein [Lysinibacillus sp. FSL W8-0992]|uniref:hypothetical protein n=1 Tax=Lysinibacillus sp. FSL W8-0992 TaxID=2954643 RepID=UPI0030FAFBE3